MIALGVIAIVVVAAVVGVILATRGGGGGGSTGGNVAGASSLQFSEDVTTSGGTKTTYTYMAKNIGTSNAMLRVEWTDSQGSYIYIVNGAQQQVWISTNGVWTDYSSYFSDYWSTWNSTFTGLQSSLSHWSGSGDYTQTDTNGDTVRIYNIVVNPSLADSLFQHS
jgi:preprotein translocase subunit SecG